MQILLTVIVLILAVIGLIAILVRYREQLFFFWDLVIIPIIAVTDRDKVSGALSTALLPPWLLFWVIPCIIEIRVIIVPLAILLIAGIVWVLRFLKRER